MRLSKQCDTCRREIVRGPIPPVNVYQTQGPRLDFKTSYNGKASICQSCLSSLLKEFYKKENRVVAKDKS